MPWDATEPLRGTPLDVTGGRRMAAGLVCPDSSGLCHVRRFHTFTDKLLTYALGRGVEDYDSPAVRGIVREAGRKISGFHRS
jgi:hypothetical protein